MMSSKDAFTTLGVAETVACAGLGAGSKPMAVASGPDDPAMCSCFTSLARMVPCCMDMAVLSGGSSLRCDRSGAAGAGRELPTLDSRRQDAPGPAPPAMIRSLAALASSATLSSRSSSADMPLCDVAPLVAALSLRTPLLTAPLLSAASTTSVVCSEPWPCTSSVERTTLKMHRRPPTQLHAPQTNPSSTLAPDRLARRHTKSTGAANAPD